LKGAASVRLAPPPPASQADSVRESGGWAHLRRSRWARSLTARLRSRSGSGLKHSVATVAASGCCWLKPTS